MPDSIGGFLPFPYKYKDSSIIRYLFVKQHEGTDDVKPSDRTLYIVNVPQYFNDKSFHLIFKEYGFIEKVYIHKKPTSGEGKPETESRYFSIREPDLGSKVCYVVFKKPNSIKKALKNSECKDLHRFKFDFCVGKKRWSAEYNSQFVDANELKNEIDKYMSNFDQNVEDEKKKEKEADGQPDEEGWVTVSKFSKKPKTPRIESVSKRIIEKHRRAEQKLSLLKFYKNQLRNAKMDQIVELRKKFEKDKARIAQMRANRKFRPF